VHGSGNIVGERLAGGSAEEAGRLARRRIRIRIRRRSRSRSRTGNAAPGLQH